MPYKKRSKIQILERLSLFANFLPTLDTATHRWAAGCPLRLLIDLDAFHAYGVDLRHNIVR
jgi:hypothetical protein